MFNVMKAQRYQLLRSNLTYCIFLFALGISAFICLISLPASIPFEQMTGSLWFVCMHGSYPMFLPMLTILFVIMICGSDLGDKTINYEVLTGTKRSGVYFGRVIMSEIMSVLCCLVTVGAPILFLTAVNGWGNAMTVSDVTLRIVSMIFPIIRLTAFFTFFAFLFKSEVAVGVTAFIALMIEMMLCSLEEIFDPSVLASLLSVFSLTRIFKIENIGFDYIDGKDVQVVKDLLETSTAMNTVISGIVGTAVLLIIGYMIFRKRDMN